MHRATPNITLDSRTIEVQRGRGLHGSSAVQRAGGHVHGFRGSGAWIHVRGTLREHGS